MCKGFHCSTLKIQEQAKVKENLCCHSGMSTPVVAERVGQWKSQWSMGVPYVAPHTRWWKKKKKNWLYMELLPPPPAVGTFHCHWSARKQNHHQNLCQHFWKFWRTGRNYLSDAMWCDLQFSFPFCVAFHACIFIKYIVSMIDCSLNFCTGVTSWG